MYKVLCVLLIGLLSACITIPQPSKLQTGVSTEPDVIAAMGKPVYIWKNQDSSQTYEYSSQPYGDTCYMITIDANGKVQKVEQTLSDEGTGRITTNMTYDQVRRILGTPHRIQTYALSGEQVWDWVTSNHPENGKLFNVHFKNGVVVKTTTTSVQTGDDGDRGR